MDGDPISIPPSARPCTRSPGRCWCWPAPAPARRASSRYRIAESDPPRHSARRGSWPSPSPTRPPAKCRSGRPSCWASGCTEKPEISTFHSLCVRILRRHIRALGYPAQFAIYDRGDQESLARAALREIKVPDGAAAARRSALFHQPLEDGRRSGPTQAAPQADDRQGAPGGDGLSPLPERAEDGRRRRLRRPAAADRRAVRQLSRRPPRRGRRASIICWSTNTRTPTAASTGSSRRWPAGIATCAWWATTTSRSTAGAAPRWRTSCASSTTGPRPRSSGWKTTTARRAEILELANRLIAFNSMRHDKVLRASRRRRRAAADPAIRRTKPTKPSRWSRDIAHR